MTPEEITNMLKQVQRGKLSVEDAVERLRNLPYEDLGYAKIDHHRSLRQGFPEVVFARGKDPAQVEGIVRRMLRNRHNILMTRGDAAFTSCCARSIPRWSSTRSPARSSFGASARFAAKARSWWCARALRTFPVAEEALVTADIMGNRTDSLYDVGVAGIHRLLGESQHLREARVIICVAGMEGALPSVVAGMVGVPVIAVPTSVGYGASFRGLAALLGMLNSCSPNVCVVNIDNGFGAGYLASVMNRL